MRVCGVRAKRYKKLIVATSTLSSACGALRGVRHVRWRVCAATRDTCTRLRGLVARHGRQRGDAQLALEGLLDDACAAGSG